MRFWRRREVYMGASAQEYAAVRRKLAAAGIPYDIKAVNRFGSTLGGGFASPRSLAGAMDERTEYMNLYYVYADKKDYDRAMQEIRTPDK